MKCYVCGGLMESVATDLPFKLDDRRILIVKGLPVEQCSSCGEHLISDAVMHVLDQLIEDTNEAVELEIRRYAA